MVGKGSLTHNSRAFKAKNVKEDYTQYNIEYCNENIKAVYHELFDKALERYNEKQTRNDRKINDYYEKIRTSKQEKLFHEVIFQIGNKDDMSAQSENGELAKKILDEFMKNFQQRNPNLKVFSAHLHMDEETPHLLIDFVPFVSGSKRGLDTRVSMKQALASMGFKGGTKQETEWSQWIASEKQELAKAMGKSRPYISNALRLLQLPKEIQTSIENGKLSQGHARALLAVEDTKKQLTIYHQVLTEKWSVRTLEKRLQELPKKQKSKKVKKVVDKYKRL